MPVYNLEVEGLHSYAVGASGVLVHNATGYTPAVNNVAKELAEAPKKKPAVAVENAPVAGASKPGSGKATAKDAPPVKTSKPTADAAVRDEFHQGRPRSNRDPRVEYESRIDGKVEQHEFRLKDYTERKKRCQEPFS